MNIKINNKDIKDADELVDKFAIENLDDEPFPDEDDNNDYPEQTILEPDEEIIDFSMQDDEETDNISPDMVDDEEYQPQIYDEETGEVFEEKDCLSGEEYVLGKLQLCDKYYNEPKCNTACPLCDKEVDCLHANIKTVEDYKLCEYRLREYLSQRKTNGKVLLNLLPPMCGFKTSFLNEEGLAWFNTEFKEE